MKSLKASSQVGIGIIVMALLLLLGGIFLDDSSDSDLFSKKNYEERSSQNQFGHDTYLFYLNNTEIGRQNKITTSFPNVELGSKEEYTTLYIGNSFQLNANPFTSNKYRLSLSLPNPQDTKALLIYFTPSRESGNRDLFIKRENRVIAQSLAKTSDSPITLYSNDFNSSETLFLELDKPAFYNIFSWNKLIMQDLRVVALSQNVNNNMKEFDFQINKDNLERVYVDLVVSCDSNTKNAEAIEIKVNDFIVANQNPNCLSSQNYISTQIPTNILKSDKNTLQFSTNGFYKVSYSLNKIYFNDQEIYKFTINDFSDIVDVVLYGDFDKEIIDLRLNSQSFSLKRDEIRSIIPYLRFGVNELKILTKPIEIKELIIEKNEFLY